MSVYPQLSNPDFYKISEEILAWWKENEIFEESISSREGQETFTFYEGPPSANGTPGIHHVMARTIKDIFCRYQTLKGKQVKRKGGWDTHGLPIELQVEKELGITKDDIGKKISVEEYNKKCREAVMKFTDQWNQLPVPRERHQRPRYRLGLVSHRRGHPVDDTGAAGSAFTDDCAGAVGSGAVVVGHGAWEILRTAAESGSGGVACGRRGAV
jgi:hypothetical protein